MVPRHAKEERNNAPTKDLHEHQKLGF